MNQKEDVIDLVLTLKGRKKLSQAKLRPTYYQFYDNEIVYDRQYITSGTYEAQNEIVDRIRQTQIFQNQNAWQGPYNQLSLERFEIAKEPNFYELGESDSFSNKKPAWAVNALRGYATGAVGFIPLEKNISNLALYQGEKIPQFNTYCQYDLYVVNDSKGNTEKIYYDRTSDDLLFLIAEYNEIDEKENFEVEVYQYVYNGNKVADLKKLYFDGKEYTEEYVEYFFNVGFDTKDALEINYVEAIKPTEDLVKEIEGECQ